MKNLHDINTKKCDCPAEGHYYFCSRSIDMEKLNTKLERLKQEFSTATIYNVATIVNNNNYWVYNPEDN